MRPAVWNCQDQRLRDLTRRNGQLEMSTALKKALLGKNRKTPDKVPVVGKDEAGSAKQKRELRK